MELFGTQLTVILCLLIGNILFGTLPVLLGKFIVCCSCSEEGWNRRIKWTTFMLYIAAGIFISDSFIVLLPQANHEFASTKKHSHNLTGNSPEHKTGQPHHHEKFPIPELTVLGGFLLGYVLQEAIHFLCSKFHRAPRKRQDMRVRFCTCAKRHTECSRTYKDARPDQTLFGMENNLLQSGNAENPATAVANIPTLQVVEVDAKSELLRSSVLAQAVPNYGTVTNVTEPAIDNPLPTLTPPVVLAEERLIATAQQAEIQNRNKFLITSLLIIITLCSQFLFLGIHLGIQAANLQRWPHLLAMCVQNFILIFSAGSCLAAGSFEFSYTIVFIGLTSIVSPTGMILAIAEQGIVEQISHLTTGIVLATACGVLLYTTFYEMLRQKIFVSMAAGNKFLAIIAGASIMTALQYITLHL